MTQSSFAQPYVPKRRMFAFSVGTSFVLVAIVVLSTLTAGAPTADAATCSQTGGPPFNWTAPGMWSNCAGGYPGQNSGDTAVLQTGGQTVNVDGIINNSVIVNSSVFATIAIPSGGSLKLEPSSTITSGNTININSGTLTINPGTFTSNANINLNTGTLTLTGNLGFTAGNGNFTFHQGTINGSGTMTLPAFQTSTWDGTGGMIVSGPVIDVFGTLGYTASASNSLSINSGAHIKVESGGTLQADGNDPIQTDNMSSPAIDILSGGSMSRSTGSTALLISCAVNNGGTISLPGTGVVLKLLGGGTHTGTFNMGSGGQSVYLNGNHIFTAFTVAPTNSTFEVLGGTTTINGSGSIANFNQDAGSTVDGTGNLTVTGTLNWLGGTQNGAGTTTCSGCIMNMTGNAIMTVDGGRVIVNNGTINYSPTSGFLDLENGGKITNNGTFNTTNTNPIQSSTPSTSYIDNTSAALFHATGTGNISIGAGFNLAGSSTLQIGAGAGVNLQGGNGSLGSFGGTAPVIDVSAVGSSLTFSAGGYLLNTNSLIVSGSGPINLTGSAIVNLAGSSYMSVANFNQTGGTLKSASAQAMSVTSQYTFDGGTLDGNSLNGTPVRIALGATMNISGGTGALLMDHAARIKNDGTLSYTSSTNPLTMNNASQIDSPGQFNYATTSNIDNTAGTAVINITTTGLTKTNGGTSQIAAQFNIAGAPLLISSGNLRLTGGGTLAPSAMKISNAADRLEISGGALKTVAINANVAVAGSGTVAVLGSNSKLGVNMGFVFAPTNLELNSGGFITGPGQVNVVNLKWFGGAFTGTGTTTLTGTGSMTSLVSSPIIADGYNFINNGGNIQYDPSSFGLTFNNSGAGGASFSNQNSGTFDIQGNGSTVVVGAGHIFTNTATVKKSAGGGSFVFTVPFVNNNPGIVDSQFAAGTIAFNNAASQMNGGLIEASNAAAAIDIQATFTVSGGTFSGPGAINLSGGPAILFINTPLTFPAKFNMSNGVLSGNGAITIPNLAQFNWSGGTITTTSGTTPIDISSGGAFNADTTTSSLVYDKRALNINSGANFNWNSGTTNNITFQTGAAVTNNGTFTVGLSSTTSIGTSTGTFANNSVFTHSGTGTLIVTVPFTNNGTVNESGILDLAFTAPVTETGTYNVLAGAFVDFDGATHTITGTTPFSGSGTVKVAAGTLQLNSNASVTNFGLINSATLSGTGNLSISNSLAWLGGTMTGSGVTTVGGATSMNTGALALSRDLTLNGATTFNDANNLTVSGAATITNNSTFTLANNSSVICSSCTGNFVNNGTITHNTTNQSAFSMPVTGSGAYTCTGGQTNFSAATNFASVTLNNGNVQFSGTPTTLGNISKTGGSTTDVFITGGTTTVSGTINLPNGTDGISISGGGSLVANNTVTVDSLYLFNGTLSGSGNVTSTGFFAFHAGTIGTGGGILDTLTGTATFDGLNGPMSLLRNWNNGANASYTPPNATNILTLGAGVAVVNNGTFSIQDQNLAATAMPIATFTNSSGANLKRIAGTTATITFDPVLTNAGNATWNVGTTHFVNGYTQTNGSTNMNGGTVNGSTININAGFLKGYGTINGNLFLGGTLDIVNGVSPSTFNVTGNYTQSNGTLKIDINGTTAGTTYDQLTVGGDVALSGTLQVTNPLGYSPAYGDIYDVLTFATNSGGTDFGTYSLPPAGGGVLQHAFVAGSPQKLRITAITSQADLSIALTGGPTPSPANHGGTTTLVYTITNNGPNAAPNVVVTDTFSGSATLNSATISGGTCTGTTCNIASLGASSSATMTIILNATAGPSSLSNSASVTSGVFDPVTANNATGTTNVTINASGDVALTITGPATASANAAVAYTATLTNNGPDNATTALTMTLTNGTISSSTCSVSGNTATCGTVTVGAGNTMTFSLTATAPAQSGTMTLAGSLTATTFDPVSANNTASVSTVVNGQADLQITKALSGALVAGSNAVYTITVTNAGPSDATAVSVSDTPPAGFTFISNAGACTSMFPCNIAMLPAGQSATITATYSVPASASGSVTNSAGVTSAVTDPIGTNNNASVTSTITQQADIAISKSGPPTAMRGAQISYTIIVSNIGPSNATNVSVADLTPSGLTLGSITGACTSFPCTIASLNAGTSASVLATYTVNANANSPITNTATASSALTDPNTANNSATVNTTVGCPSAVASTTPAPAATGVPLTGTLSWASAGATSYKVYFGAAGSGCTAPFYATTSANAVTYSNLMPATTYEWRVESISSSCAIASTSCMTFTTITQCPQGPANTAPANGATITSPVTFQWTPVANASDYHVFASVNGGPSIDVGTSTTNSLGGINLNDGAVTWYVVANVPGCGALQSNSGSFTVCNVIAAPVVSVVANAASGQNYNVTWDPITGATKYEIDEATNAAFTNATTKTVTNTSVLYNHAVSNASPFFYRVRASGGCTQSFGPYSLTARIVLIPIPPPANKPPTSTPNVNVPAGSNQVVVQTVFVAGFADGSFPFTATTDKPWLTVSPSMGTLTPAGITLQVLADPTTLLNGTQTGTIIMSIGAAGKAASNATSSVSIPVSVSLVTPVSSVSKKGVPTNALIIPSVGHLDGFNSKWQSDVRVTNTGTAKAKYLLTFTPDDPDRGIKQTQIDVAGGDTTALDDIVQNWYGVGALGETANGVLEIRPLDGSGKGLGSDAVSISTATVASSRTYNVTSNGTLGQYIPAIPFGNFIAKGAAALSLQQIAQNAQYRTNLGIVEAGGFPVTALLSVFNSSGAKLFEQTLDLKANQQKQLNGFLSANGISMDDGRIEVSVVNGDGKVTSYASVVDNLTQDPLLVNGVQAATTQSNRYVLPGVAALNNGFANWRTDVRVFNSGATSQAATVTYYPANNSGDPIANSIFIEPGAVKSLDDVLNNFFALGDGAGSLHVTTGNQSSLVVTGRTYNKTDNGTYGQFVPAVTPNDGIGKGGRSLNILQVEDSVRYRTNIGVAEVSGQAARVEISAIIPESKTIPKVTIDLAPNEFIQSAVLHDLGLTNVYNARISIKVIDGNGKVAAYGSVIDMKTQDPTYVPAQ